MTSYFTLNISQSDMIKLFDNSNLNIREYRKEEAEEDKEAEGFDKYLMSWRECEHHLEKRSWKIEKK